MPQVPAPTTDVRTKSCTPSRLENEQAATSTISPSTVMDVTGRARESLTRPPAPTTSAPTPARGGGDARLDNPVDGRGHAAVRFENASTVIVRQGQRSGDGWWRPRRGTL